MKGGLNELYEPWNYVEFACPKCGAPIAYFEVSISFGRGYATKYFQCTACESTLCVSRKYLWSVFLVTLALALAIAFALRVQPWWFFAVVACVAWGVVSWLAGMYVKWLFPPQIYCGDYSFLIRN
jgi:predicted RNA-binding Zn-ribbon protein involved in translation (DUF1610 family)